MIWILIILGWLACGIIDAGWTFAYFQEEYPSLAKRDRQFDLKFGLTLGVIFGPVALIGTLFTPDYRKHGWRLKSK